MGQIDWSKAPADATHWDANPNRVGSFMKLERGNWFFWPVGETLETRWHTWNREGRNDLTGLVPRPATWNGEGLPPVGLECEQRIDFKKAPAYTIINLTELGVDVQKHLPRFQKVKILYASEKYVVSEANGVECMAPSSCVEFRPVRTAEQVAAEQREKAIDAMNAIAVESVRLKGHTGRETCETLYDAGYRKVEK